MKKLLIGIVMIGLLIGTTAISKAADFNVNFGDRHDDYGYRSQYYGRDFDRWDQRMRFRMDQGLRSGDLTRREYRDLSQDLREIENFHSDAWSNGSISPREARQLERMQDRFSARLFAERHD